LRGDPGRCSILPDGVIERLDLSVAPDPAASGMARAALAAWAGGTVPAHVLADVQLLLSELVTNSLRHGGLRPGEVVHVAASLTNGSVRLEVENPGVEGEIVPRAPGMDGAGGFGLQLVDALSERWGVVRDGATCVWVEIAAHPTG
jgi:anti-sigma regulatory factor (Ser/Thr protein kinase)